MLEVFLIARGTVVVVVAEGAAALEVAARWGAGVGFGDLGVLDCVRLWLRRLGAGSGCEDNGAAEVWWCAGDFGTRRECGKVGRKERLQCATCAVHVGAGRLAD